jgi:hypothetical protein
MDLNLENYNLNKLLELFNIEGELTEIKIKVARKKVLALHPDKTRDRDTYIYYEFFTKAYNKLVDVYSYTKSLTTSQNQRQEPIEISNIFSKYAEKKQLKDDKLQKEFNKMFDEVYIKDNDGYEEWLKSNDDIHGNSDIKKARQSAIVLHKTNEIETYNSGDKFSDLKAIYTNTVISIDEEREFNNKKQYSSVDSYIRDREYSLAKQKNYTEDESIEILRNQELKQQHTAMQMAFDMKNKTEIVNNRLNQYYSKYLTIHN